MAHPYARSGQLPPTPADPKAVEEAKKKAEVQKNLNAERIAAIALGQDPNKAVTAAKAQPTLIVSQEKAAADQAAEQALKSVEAKHPEDEEDEEF